MSDLPLIIATALLWVVIVIPTIVQAAFLTVGGAV